MKKHLHFLMILLIMSLMFSCDKNSGVIEVSWQLIENQYDGKSQLKSEVTFTNNSPYTLTNDNWKFYFNWFRSIRDKQEYDMLKGETINGDLSYLEPTEKFEDLKPGESFTFPLLGTHHAINFTDAITGAYFVIKDKNAKEILLPSGETKVLPFPENKNLSLGSHDNLKVQTAEIRYKENELIAFFPEEGLPLLIPSPMSQELMNGQVLMPRNMTIFHQAELYSEAEFLHEKLNLLYKINSKLELFYPEELKTPNTSYIVMMLVDGPEEAYSLTVDAKKGFLIKGADKAGAFYGVQSLLSIIGNNDPATNQLIVPALYVEDKPRFEYRGIHIDVSRSFHQKDDIKKFMDLISMYKLNKLHFHITDDEGWRVEIKPLPELTEIGAFRGHSNNEKDHLQPSLGSGPFADPKIGHGSGFYTREEFIELLKYAKRRHIEVIPEIDMPGHIRSALKAMEVRYDRYMAEGKKDSAEMYLLTDFDDTTFYTSAQRFHDNTANPCMESTYRFVEVVVDELVEMYKEADLPLNALHIGGDEVPNGAFTYSPICQEFLANSDEYNSVSQLHKYFTTRTTEILKKYDIYTAGWEEVACKHENGKRVPDPSLVKEGIQAYIWNNVWGWGAEDLGYKLANEGFPVVLLSANNYYFDFAYNKDPEEPGLYWGGYTDTRSAWEFTPMDITKCAETTLTGNPIDESMFESKVRLTEKGKKNIRGLSGVLWGETMWTWDRVEYMAFPKILGLAERAWAQTPYWVQITNKDFFNIVREKDWSLFANKLGKHEFRKLDKYDVNYRIALPGAIIEDHLFIANIRFPGLTMRYTLDGSEPGVNSAIYTKPFKVNSGDTIKIAAFNSKGRSSRVVKVCSK